MIYKSYTSPTSGIVFRLPPVPEPPMDDRDLERWAMDYACLAMEHMIKHNQKLREEFEAQIWVQRFVDQWRNV
jgi:hypothetical protein